MRVREELFQFVTRWKSSLLFLLIGLLAPSIIYLYTGEFELLYMQKILLSIALIILFRFGWLNSLGKIFAVLASYSFSLYCIHIYVHIFIGQVFYMSHVNFISDILKVSLYFVLNVSLGVLFIYLAKRLIGAQYSQGNSWIID